MSKSEIERLCEEGQAALNERDHATANDAFEEALAINPDCVAAIEGMATISYLDDDYQGAIQHYSRLIQLKPMDSRNYVNLGAIYNRLGDHAKAADILRKAIMRDKKSAEAYYNLGIAQRKLKQNAMAVSAYKEAIKLNPQMHEAHQNLGNVYVEMGNLQMAVASFKKALEVKPDFEKARLGLEHAEEALAISKKGSNPFGRLVDVNARKSSVATMDVRELSDEEREQDRLVLRQLSDETERLSKACLEYLRQKLEPAVMEVERAMGVMREDILPLLEAKEALEESLVQWNALRQAQKRKLLELRAHEEFVNAPVVKL